MRLYATALATPRELILDTFPDSAVNVAALTKHLVSTDLFFCAKPIGELLDRASQTFPINEHFYLPRLTQGFVVFERPLLGLVAQDLKTNGEIPLSAIYWCTGMDSDGPVLLIVGFAWLGAHCVPFLMAGIQPAFLADQHVVGDSNVDKAAMIRILQFIGTLSAFIEQRIAETSTAVITRRVTECVQPYRPNPTIQVIALRRATRDRSGHDDSMTMDWACHWLVRGHWRQQFYPKAFRYMPIWILPHMKGSLEKPFKAPNPLVYAVTR